MWCRSLAKQAWKNKTPVTQHKLPNPNDLSLYFSGSRATKSAKQLSTENVTATRDNHTLIRNNLLYRIIVANGSRTGYIINKTIEEYKKNI